MKTVLFLHGFFASGSCVPAMTIRECLEGEFRILTPDLPLHPYAALELIHSICDREHPDLLVGNSCGSFYAQILAPVVGIPALLGNPHFCMTEFLRERIGSHQYKSVRADGQQNFVIDAALIDEFKQLEQEEFDFTSPFYTNKVWGIFGQQDQLAHYEALFLQYYNQSYHFPGGHTPTTEEVREYYIPLIRQMLQQFEKPTERLFRHFKGMNYRFLYSAYDSETLQRMVVYQKQYGDFSIWVRPEKMFFQKLTRDGRTQNRFTEYSA